MRRALAGALALAVGAVVVACYAPPKAGESCNNAVVSCFDPKTALECVGGVRVGVHCGGPSGCGSDGLRVWCDESTANENDVCITSRMHTTGDGACSPDRRSLLQCRGGHFVTAELCHGPRGCSHEGRMTSCDTSVAAPGDLCLFDKAPACTGDGGQLLECLGGRFVTLASCAGPEHCRPDGPRIRCDQRVGVAGEKCEATGACAADKSTLLECRDHVWAPIADCRGPSGCHLEGDLVACDASTAVLGERCDGKGASCTADKKQMLKCDGGKWSLEHACPRGCEVRPSEHLVSCK